eukprot:CAMPEP_0197241726 /NCGR_PEP_ID=MMETSP1429-20130617/7684_1 /TAXON_ID=49237 /ORGANISM="Chaetoceros  sp., Strain UNC1202" /LENGTH=228 /DNA_ID=CAMNT_0042701613 /DNA_START=126 /DNA_END=812 /DNA_ORIENTATION=-
MRVVVCFLTYASSFLLLSCNHVSGFALSRPKVGSLTRVGAVAGPPNLPAEYQEEEREKRKKTAIDSDSSKDWTPTKGGFFANLTKRKREKNKRKKTVEVVDNIVDYKSVVVDEDEKIVVVRFFASWCRSCKATEPVFNKLVNQSPDHVKFVQVPLTKETSFLQEGLGVPSIPFAHIYHPEAGLVEEMKASKPKFREFQQTLQSYIVGSCDLPEDEEEGFLAETVGDFQ